MNKQLIKKSFGILQLKALKETPGNPQSMTQAEFNGMVESMKSKGWILDAPVCWKRPDGEYQIISGHHRVAAGIKAGIIETECKIIEGLTEKQALIFNLEANQRRGRFDDKMLNEFIDEIINNFDIERNLLFEEVGFFIDAHEEFSDFKEFENEMKEIDGYNDIDLKITIPAKYVDEVKNILLENVNAHDTSAGLGQGLLRLCGLL